MIKLSSICFPLIALYLYASLPLRAQEKKAAGEGAKTSRAEKAERKGAGEEEGEEEQSKGLQVGKLLPLNKPNLRVKIPGFDKGELATMVEAETLTRIDEVNLRLEDATIQLVPQELTIKLRTALYNTDRAILSSNETTTVSSKEFTITGATMDFDTRTGKGRMVGPTRMLIHNVSAMTGEGEGEKKAKAGAAATTRGASAAVPTIREETKK